MLTIAPDFNFIFYVNLTSFGTTIAHCGLTAFLSAKLSFTLCSIVLSKQPTRKPLPKRRKPAPKQEEDVVTPGPSDVDDETAVNTRKPNVKSKDIQGLKYFDMLLPLLERLHDDHCKRDKANNRELHFDKY